ncbi:MAG TPA: serine hydroxymethyltransferase [Candidatus Omnitrophota bacterium]|nr:serine hydroxymethyltransferase [Candidatus Omnitrophota bacterium]HNQ50696.1 serine hydroxymethyltransferase [Candidatus Omnitrophota bacterium]HQO37441.1 serine hydroxymethyltransferase [Candidatus Omnitrophota bacterium]HQQ05682.1 serine hydroxymethyltransferase [Candidatus Omnitrophota bacterium]
MKHLRSLDPDVYGAIRKEITRQQDNLEMIASENFTSVAVLEAQGSVLTNKYAEGYPGRRWYGGCEHVDVIEELAIERAQALFGAEYANVQPHSGTQANMAVFFVALKPGDPYMAMDLACGGHLSHGHAHNFSGMFYKAIPYGVDRKTECIDYDVLAAMAKKHRPRMILAGASAYSREIDFKRLRQICDDVGAIMFVDMAHIAGLVAAGIHPSPVPYADIVTSTTHKTLRGPRGGFILAKKEWARKLDSFVFPGMQGGPLMHVIAAKAVAFKLAREDSFRQYQNQIVKNARRLARQLDEKGFRIVSGGTDNHMVLVDLTSKHITGKEASSLLEKVNITINKNLIPYDPLPPAQASGIRLGTPAITTRGVVEDDIDIIAGCIDGAIGDRNDDKALARIRKEVLKMTKKYPLYPELQGTIT